MKFLKLLLIFNLLAAPISFTKTNQLNLKLSKEVYFYSVATTCTLLTIFGIRKLVEQYKTKNESSIFKRKLNERIENIKFRINNFIKNFVAQEISKSKTLAKGATILGICGLIGCAIYKFKEMRK